METGKTASFGVAVSAAATANLTGLESTSAFAGLMATNDGLGNYTALWATGAAPLEWVGKTAAMNV